MRFILSFLFIVACKGGEEPTDTTDPVVDDTDTDTDTGPDICGDAAPVFVSFAVSNGSSAQGATGTSLLIEGQITDADGDLEPEIGLAVVWDTTIDGQVGTDNGFVLRLLAPADTPTCGASAIGFANPFSYADIAQASTGGDAFPANTMIEMQAVVIDNAGLVTEDVAPHSGLSQVITVCTPNTDGTDGTCTT